MMINGFVIEIKNISTHKHTVRLFSDDDLPEGVTIVTRNPKFDYKALRSFAMTDGFIGSGVSSDEVLVFTIQNGGKSASFITKFLTDKKIVIDGDSKCIAVSVPPGAVLMFQLLPRM